MKTVLIVFGLIITALIIGLSCGVPALEWLGKFFDGVKIVFAKLVDGCRLLQRLINWGVIHK